MILFEAHQSDMRVIYVAAVLLSALIVPCYGLSRDDPEVSRIIRHHWKQHKKLSVILAYLNIVHHVSASLSWLKRRLREMGLFRRKNVQYTPINLIKAAIKNEISGPNCNIGYRQMWRIIQNKYNYVVKRSTVMMLAKVLNPVGVENRRRHRLRRRVYQNKGPNFVWHLDGYDKLKPYGFPIHGCIDGYSRKILWLKLTSTNNNPKVILLYYLNTVLSCQGVPTIVRSDCGTENSALASCHMTLRHSHGDEFSGGKSFRYGSSTTNTRIESWWGQLRKSVTEFWINLFKDFIGSGNYNPNLLLHKHCIAYVYEPLIKKALDDFKERWNCHAIRPNRLAGCPSGVPDDLYSLPQLTGTSDYRKELNYEAWATCYTNYACKAPNFFPEEFSVAASAILQEDLHLQRSDINIDNAKLVYLYLLNVFN